MRPCDTSSSGSKDSLWNCDSGATFNAREILGLKYRTGDRCVHYLERGNFKALDSVADVGLRDQVVNVMVHHLRIVGRVDAVSQGTHDPDLAA